MADNDGWVNPRLTLTPLSPYRRPYATRSPRRPIVTPRCPPPRLSLRAVGSLAVRQMGIPRPLSSSPFPSPSGGMVIYGDLLTPPPSHSFLSHLLSPPPSHSIATPPRPPIRIGSEVVFNHSSYKLNSTVMSIPVDLGSPAAWRKHGAKLERR